MINLNPKAAMKKRSTRPLRIIIAILFSFTFTVAVAQRNTTPPLPEQTFEVSLYHTGADSIRNFLNGVLTVYDDNFSAAVDANDQLDDNNPAENIAVTRDGFYLGVELRPLITSADTMPLLIEHMNLLNYELELTGSNFSNPALIATLIDNFTGDHILLSTGGTVIVPFTITTNPASSAPDRFMIIFSTPGTLAVSGLVISACQKRINNVDGIQVDWITQNEKDMDRYEIERSANCSTFSKLAAQPASGNNGGNTTYTWLDKEPLIVMNFYRIRAVEKNGIIRYSSIKKMQMAKSTSAFSIYPNPVTGNDLNLQLKDLKKGTYSVSITNLEGQQLFSAQFKHAGGSSTKNIEINRHLPNGLYQLQVIGDGVEMVQELLRK
jgi:Secretion system C-terminal sorting domain